MIHDVGSVKKINYVPQHLINDREVIRIIQSPQNLVACLLDFSSLNNYHHSTNP